MAVEVTFVGGPLAGQTRQYHKDPRVVAATREATAQGVKGLYRTAHGAEGITARWHGTEKEGR